MFISRREGDTTSTVHVDTTGDLFWAIVMLVVGACVTLAVIKHPMQHYIALLIGVGLMWLGWSFAVQTGRLIRRGARTYRS
jgi:hypothetical protein